MPLPYAAHHAVQPNDCHSRARARGHACLRHCGDGDDTADAGAADLTGDRGSGIS